MELRLREGIVHDNAVQIFVVHPFLWCIGTGWSVYNGLVGQSVNCVSIAVLRFWFDFDKVIVTRGGGVRVRGSCSQASPRQKYDLTVSYGNKLVTDHS